MPFPGPGNGMFPGLARKHLRWPGCCHTVVLKIFVDDINMLVSMQDLWKPRKPHSPLRDVEGSLNAALVANTPERGSLADSKVWGEKLQVQVLMSSYHQLIQC